MSLPISPPATAVTACQKCGECCKRYAISALPHELKREAAFFNLGEKEFVGIYGRLLVQFLPFESNEHPLAMPVCLIPKRVFSELKRAGFDGEFAIMLPMIGFKKGEYCVFFDPKTFGCSMHVVKPMQCTLFPFTSLKDNEDYAKAYDFCELSKISSPTASTKEIQLYHRAQWKQFFDTVALEGLGAAYPHWPAEGEMVFNGKTIGHLTLGELHEWVEMAQSKV